MFVLMYIQITMFVIIVLSSTVAEFDEEMKDNNIKSTTHLCHICKEKNRISKTVSSKNKYQKRKLQI